MGFLMFVARKIQLEDRQNNIEFQLTSINSKLNDYTSYASILAQDSISMGDIGSIPSSLFSQGIAELTNTHFMATQIAQNNFSQAMSTGMFGQGDNAYIQQLTMQKLYEDARKQIQKQLAARLNEEEKSLNAKKTRLEVQLKQIETELQAMDQKISQGAQRAVSTYGLKA